MCYILSYPTTGVEATYSFGLIFYTMVSFKKIQSFNLPPPIFLISNKQVSHTWMLQGWPLIFWMLEHFVQTSMDIWWLLIYPGKITNRFNRLNQLLCRIFKTKEKATWTRKKKKISQSYTCTCFKNAFHGTHIHCWQ